jgi:hypothetical protein
MALVCSEESSVFVSSRVFTRQAELLPASQGYYNNTTHLL